MLILASQSPRRSELLRAAKIPFEMRVADIDETPFEGEAPDAYVVRLAIEKAKAVAGDAVLAADTTVVLDGEILAKPEDAADAVRMLTGLAGRSHEVLTGVCLRLGDRVESALARTIVWFDAMTAEEIAEYVATGEPMDKAGAYGIQGMASRWINRVDGSYTNVVGLPVALVFAMLKANSLV